MNDTRTRTVLHHSKIGKVEFAWDDGEWVVACFSPILSVPYWLVLGNRLEAGQPHSVTKDVARMMWEEFIRQGWNRIES